MEKENSISYRVWGNYALFSDPINRMGGKNSLSDSHIPGACGNYGINLLETNISLGNRRAAGNEADPFRIQGDSAGLATRAAIRCRSTPTYPTWSIRSRHILNGMKTAPRWPTTEMRTSTISSAAGRWRGADDGHLSGHQGMPGLCGAPAFLGKEKAIMTGLAANCHSV